MAERHRPADDARYWAAMCAASVFGANLGDFVSHVLHLGHYRGLPPLMVLFALILWLERRSSMRTVAFYWLAVVVLRTGATNVADLATHDWRIDGVLVSAGLGVLLVVCVAGWRRQDGANLPPPGARYWATLFVAGIFGTALGDTIADAPGVGLGLASVMTAVACAGALAVRRRGALPAVMSYWLAIAAIRLAGTNIGDFLAGVEGIALGLPVSTAATGFVFLGVLLLWKPRRQAVTA